MLLSSSSPHASSSSSTSVMEFTRPWLCLIAAISRKLEDVGKSGGAKASAEGLGLTTGSVLARLASS